MSENSQAKTTRRVHRVYGPKELIDPVTGEVFETHHIQLEERDANFSKIWLNDMLNEAIQQLTGQRYKVLIFLMKEAPKFNNIVPYSTRQIAEMTGISPNTVNRALKILQDYGIIIRGYGKIFVNPDVIYKGGHSKRMDTVRHFQNMQEQYAEKGKKPSG